MFSPAVVTGPLMVNWHVQNITYISSQNIIIGTFCLKKHNKRTGLLCRKSATCNMQTIQTQTKLHFLNTINKQHLNSLCTDDDDYDDIDNLMFYIPFNIYVISRQWEGDNERLCGIKCHKVMSWIPPPVGFKPYGILWSEDMNANHSATCLLLMYWL